MPKVIIVAYRTRIASDDIDLPKFTAPKNYTDPRKIDKHIKDKEAEFVASARYKPYIGTFDEVRIYDQASKETGQWAYREPDSGRKPVCLAVRDWLLKRHPQAWPHSTHSGGSPEAVFVGFNPRLFLKILGMECSLPQNRPKAEDGETDPVRLNVLPLSMWYGNSDHRDIEEAVKPREFDLSWDIVLKARGIDADGWEGPGENTEKDIRLAIELATQLGMLVDCE